MQKSISILGSTGSIGRQTLEVVKKLDIRVLALAAGHASPRLEEQARAVRPALVAVYDEAGARDMAGRLRDLPVKVVSGEEGLCQAASLEEADCVVTAVVGTVGLMPTLTAIDAGKRIALANKETLVCAGALVMKRARERGAEIIPVDSEHSAIFQCLAGSGGKALQKIILTASGGPFRGRTREELSRVTKEEALKHPSWRMGPKITVDSATMMNKGLELVEAMHLFSQPAEDIDILVHPQSIIHSMVAFEDNSVLAQLSPPDMRLPIQYALTYPERAVSLTPELNLAEIGTLTFEKPEEDVFGCLKLAKKAAREGGVACAVLNAANEAAVELFLMGKISFLEIEEYVSGALETIRNISAPALVDILSADAAAREYVRARAL
ncbi:MAG TPA: 1-deoxy-D-xylulose-5-phosphate reductoisomerase [Papillibacter sp.]|nr:1-deoxy-D-xylulose-5-phosphate reductoisomerase [Papillibacter sp.]